MTVMRGPSPVTSSHIPGHPTSCRKMPGRGLERLATKCTNAAPGRHGDGHGGPRRPGGGDPGRPARQIRSAQIHWIGSAKTRLPPAWSGTRHQSRRFRISLIRTLLVALGRAPIPMCSRACSITSSAPTEGRHRLSRWQRHQSRHGAGRGSGPLGWSWSSVISNPAHLAEGEDTGCAGDVRRTVPCARRAVRDGPCQDRPRRISSARLRVLGQGVRIVGPKVPADRVEALRVRSWRPEGYQVPGGCHEEQDRNHADLGEAAQNGREDVRPAARPVTPPGRDQYRAYRVAKAVIPVVKLSGKITG